MNSKLISVIIPTLNEEKTIQQCLSQFNDLSKPFEIIVADGGSTDTTKEIIKTFKDVKLVGSEKGRGNQMNTGAKAASGKILLFLHSDTMLPQNGLNLIREVLEKPKAAGGYFRLQHDESTFWYRSLKWLINWRSKLPNVTPYGDQAIFCTKDAFGEVGGFKDIQIMEDYDFAKKLKKFGKLIRINEVVTSSFRRYKIGAVKYMLKCNLIWLLYHLGVSPYFLKKLYKDVR